MKGCDAIKEVKSCSRCGLCAQVCPIFEVEKNEASLCRGKFLQLLGILRGDLKFNRKIDHNLKLCINCGKCMSNCPSGINTIKILSEIKYKKIGIVEKFLGSEFVFNLKLLPFKILNFLQAKKLPLNLDKNSEIYFKGCLSGYCAKSPFKCCASPFFVGGRKDIYEKLAQYNLKVIENENIKKVFFDCATCLNEVKKYPFKNPESINKLVFLDTLNIISGQIKNKNFTFYRPCHLQIGDFEKIEKSFNDLANYVPFENSQDEHGCCGFGGDFFLRHPFIAHKLSIKLAQKIYQTGATIVVTPCPSCVWSLKWGLWFLKTFKYFGTKNNTNKTADVINKNIRVLGL